MNRHAVPLILAAVLSAGGGGAATWALAGDDNATSKGNQAPIDDNHQGSPAPAVVPTQGPRATASPAPRHEATHDASHAATHEASHEPEPGEVGSPSSEPEPADDHGTDPAPEASETEHGGDNGSGHT